MMRELVGDWLSLIFQIHIFGIPADRLIPIEYAKELRAQGVLDDEFKLTYEALIELAEYIPAVKQDLKEVKQ